jgi:hypothetical protein
MQRRKSANSNQPSHFVQFMQPYRATFGEDLWVTREVATDQMRSQQERQAVALELVSALVEYFGFAVLAGPGTRSFGKSAWTSTRISRHHTMSARSVRRPGLQIRRDEGARLGRPVRNLVVAKARCAIRRLGRLSDDHRDPYSQGLPAIASGEL